MRHDATLFQPVSMGKNRRQAQGEHRRPGIEDGSRVRGLRPDVQRASHRSTVLQSPMSTAGISTPTWTCHVSGFGSPVDPDRPRRARRLLAVRFGAWTGPHISVLRADRPGGRRSTRPSKIVEHITKVVMKWTSDDPDPRPHRHGLRRSYQRSAGRSPRGSMVGANVDFRTMLTP